MARQVDRLNVRGLAGLAAGLHADGGGLYLRVETSGARRWTFIFRFHARRREMGLGALSDISLAVARRLAQEAREAVQMGSDPVHDRQRRRAAQKPLPFGEFADRVIDDIEPKWKNPRSAQQWRSTLTNDAKALRLKPVHQIGTEDVLAVLKPIWQTKRETARRLRGRIEFMLDAAKVEGLREGDNPARWKGHLALLLHGRKKVRHHPALPYAELPSFMQQLRLSPSISAQALDFTILTDARTCDTILSQGSEIDERRAIWEIPAERMKAGRPHRVPLSPPALAIAKARLRLMGPDGYLFPGLKRGKPLSNAAMAKMLELMGRDDVTVHGFRSTFRDWAYDCTNFPREIVEAAMAHILGDEAELAYKRSDALERRRKLMVAFADFAAARRGTVVRLAG